MTLVHIAQIIGGAACLLTFTLGVLIIRREVLRHNKWMEKHRKRIEAYEFWTKQCQQAFEQLDAAKARGDRKAVEQIRATLLINIRRYEKDVMGWR
jgi:hypothetical protein